MLEIVFWYISILALNETAIIRIHVFSQQNLMNAVSVHLRNTELEQ